MEQKWKVKNLLFGKKLWNSGIFTVILCILWWILCGCAMLLLLIKSPILAADWDTIPTIPLTYRWVDDKTEVLDRLSFMYTGEDDQMTVVTEMYQEWKNLYVVPKPLIVNVSLDPSNPYKNKVWLWVWWNILWWRDNEINSDNITLVWWQWNRIEFGNTNATLLWWKENKIQWWNESPVIMVWWEGNIALENKWVNVLIWWSGSRVYGTEGVNVVWWSNIKLDGWSNVIVWWSNVSVGGDVDNVFIFSPGNSQFRPDNTDGDNAFYLDVDNGLWLNRPWSKWWVESQWAVSFWEIDIDTDCWEADLWVQWVWDGCLVGCTRASLDEWNKWEMLDQWTDCIEKCEANPKCTTADDNNTVIPYDSFCTTGAISTENAYMCDTWALADHENVVFETTLIDSENNCPNWENKCVYKCNEWYHLTWDKTWKPNSINPIACYSDCTLPWTGENWETIKIKHNEMVTWYNTDQAFCSVDNFKFWEDKETDHDTCKNHKKTLICVDGILYIATGGNATDQKADSPNSEHNYTIGTCNLNQFRCDTSATGYNLTWGAITWQLKDITTWTGGYLNKRDWMRVNWEKWIYKLCINYDPVDNLNGEHCNEVEPYTFRLVWCMPDYMTWEHHPWECRKQVDLTFDFSANAWNGNVWFKWTGNNDDNTLSPVTEGYSTGLIGPDAPIAGKTTVASGWTFVWWNTGQDAHEGLTWFEMPGESLTFYAIYTKEVTATFNENGTGIMLSGETMTWCVMWNSDTGCSFTWKYDFNVIWWWNWIKDGWNNNPNATGVRIPVWVTVVTTIDRDVNFYTISHMPRKVIFYKNGAEKLDPETGSNTGVSTELWCDWYNNQSQLGTGCKVITPKIIRSGWKALWWGDDSNGTGIKFKVNTGLYTKEGTRAYYAITKKALTWNFDPNRDATYNQYALLYPEWIHRDKELCDIYNLETWCNITTQVFNTTERYLPRWWTLYTGDVKSAADVKGLDTEVRLTGDTVFYAQVKSSCMTGDEEDLQTIKVTYDVELNKWSAVILPDWTKVNGDYSLYALPWSMLTGYKWYKSWWTFEWWSTKTGKDVKIALTGVQVQCDEVKLYALFKKECEVFFNPNGGTIYSSGYYMGNKIATGSCTIWNRNSSCPGNLGIFSPQVISWISTPTPLGFSLWANDHTIVWSGNTLISPSISWKWIRCGETYYAQTKRDVKLIFDKNGNKGTDKTIRACTYYNTGDACTTDDIKSPKCVPFTGYEVIWWSTAADRHENDWPSETTGGKLKLTGDTTYYCQSQKNITVKFNRNGNIISGSDTSSCTGYNGSWCEIKAPDCIPATGGYRVIWWSSATGKHVNEWSTWTGKIFTTSGTYYCQSEKDIMVTFNPNGNTLTGSKTSTCTGYNGSWCEIKAIDFIPATWYTQTWWSTATGKHVNEWPIWSGKIFTKSGTYYAQSYKDITVTFDSNGNIISGSNESSCTGYNGSGCEIKAKDFKPYAWHTKIWWSSATGKHINEWSPWTGKIFTTSGTYYAQSYKVYTVKFNSTDGCVVSGTDEKYWTGYNGLGWRTWFISPGIKTSLDMLWEWWNTWVYLDTGYWQVDTSKIIEFSNLSTWVQYYAQCRPEENGTCGDCAYTCNSWYMVRTWTNTSKLAQWMCIWRDGFKGCTNECGTGELLRWNDDDGWGCRKSCNSCAKSGFPYCFPIDFSDSCNETLSNSSCNVDSTPVIPEPAESTTCKCFGVDKKPGELCRSYNVSSSCDCSNGWWISKCQADWSWSPNLRNNKSCTYKPASECWGWGGWWVTYNNWWSASRSASRSAWWSVWGCLAFRASTVGECDHTSFNCQCWSEEAYMGNDSQGPAGYWCTPWMYWQEIGGRKRDTYGCCSCS